MNEFLFQCLFIECGSNNYGKDCLQPCQCNVANTDDCNNVHGNCTCKNGWKGSTCDEDKDECDDTTICDIVPNSSCNNLNGSYECNCKIGYQKLENGTCLGKTPVCPHLLISVILLKLTWINMNAYACMGCNKTLHIYRFPLARAFSYVSKVKIILIPKGGAW